MPITSNSYERLIEKRQKNDIWIVMFHTESNFHSEKAYKKFVNASNLASGMFHFGLVKTKRDPLLVRKFSLKNQPSLIVFHYDGFAEYTGSYNPSEILHFASKYLQDHTIEIDESWKYNSKPSAILFTNKEKTPILWLGISNIFSKPQYGSRIGICHNSSLFSYFNITTLPRILFVNKSLMHEYTGKFEVALIQRQFESFIEKRLKLSENSSESILPSNQFINQCVGGQTICVIHTSSEHDPGFSEIQQIYENVEYKWFEGSENLPFEFMKKDEIWIYNPKLEGFINVSHITALNSILKKVYDSSAEWKRKNEIIQSTNEL